ncbi:hypothetical protein HAV15_011165 [Penicillium sp. str. |nr:hypothetical protein HAV15_011165 [Penicillium sp. str. \
MPPTIVYVPSITVIASSSSDQTEKLKATSLPGSITPSNESNEVTEASYDTTLLQLGFNGQLPWPFVAIESALPALSANDRPVMFALEPYHGWQTTGYSATLAIFYFPTSKVDLIRDLKVNPNSALYNQASDPIQSQTSMVDPAMPLEFPSNYASGGSDLTDSGGSTDRSDSGSDGDNINGDGSASSSKAKASSAGVGCGVVAGAGAYGAGMFWIPRRYRRRKHPDQRSNHSDTAVSSMFAAALRLW